MGNVEESRGKRVLEGRTARVRRVDIEGACIGPVCILEVESLVQQQLIHRFPLSSPTMFSRCRSLFLTLFTFTLFPAHAHPSLPHINALHRRAGTWTLTQNGTTGVSAMMMVVLNPTMVLFLDKVEDNALRTPDGNPAWGALFNLDTKAVTPLKLKTNTFCAGGAFISNGSFVSTGGNGIVSEYEAADGWQGLRLMQPCTSATGAGCTIYENPATFHLLVDRWYPTAIRLYDGSAMIIGGTSVGGFYNDIPGANMASYEYFPKKFWMPSPFTVPSDFLLRTAPANLFPIAFAMIDGRLFLAANNQTIVYDSDYNYEIRLPDIPNGYRVTYPFSAAAIVLPMYPPNYTQDVLICGGTNMNDALPSTSLSTQTPSSNFCFRMTLTEAGVAQGWATETMPDRRVMPDLVMVPTGEVIIVNGAKTGAAGYGNFLDNVGQSNADQPAYRPVLYTPTAAAGSRFSTTGMPTSNIPRMYHSVATLTAKGNIIIAGSNPNAGVYDFPPNWPYPAEYRVEFLNPPWMTVARPTLVNPPAKFSFNTQYTFNVTVPAGLNTTASQVKGIYPVFGSWVTENLTDAASSQLH